MFHLHFRRNLRSFVFLLITAVVITCAAALWWANRTGLPESWRQAIENAIEEKGIHAHIGSLSIDPLRGLVASSVKIFADTSHTTTIAALDRVTFDFDKAKLARGKILVTRIELINGSLTLPVDPTHPDAGTLTATRLHGTLLMPGERRFEFRRARGIVAGIDITLDARLVGWHADASSPPDPQTTGRRRKLIAQAVKQLSVWKFDRKKPPQLEIVLEGNLNTPSSLHARMQLKAENVEKNNHVLRSVEMAAATEGNLVTIHRVFATDFRGKLTGKGDYDLSERAGRFDIVSSLDIPALLGSWTTFPALPEIKIRGSQNLTAQGNFSLPENAPPLVSATGGVDCRNVEFRSTHFDRVSSAFGWKDGSLFLRDLKVGTKDGEASGKLLFARPLVRVAVDSTLPFSAYFPLLEKQEILQNVIRDFSPLAKSSRTLRLEGTFHTDEPSRWSVKGECRFSRMAFRNVPIRNANCRFDLNRDQLDFHDGEIEFDYANYSLRNAYNGPSKGNGTIGRILYDHNRKVVEVTNVSGTMWPVPLIRLFAAKISPYLEPYRFHSPPHLTGNGIVDVTSRGRTDMTVAFSSSSPADYTLFGKQITLGSPSGKVLIRGGGVTVDDLKTTVFDGTAAGTIASKDGELATNIHWSRLSVPEIGKTYQFEIKGGGRLTGRVNCTTKRGDIATAQGEGLLAIEKAELFSVPIFGPLSSLISSALDDKRSGYERAKSAFVTFLIRDGVISTNNFQTSTTSLAFTGNGQLDLRSMTFDMTIRMNAHGLLGLITLPLKPFYGMFQFRGRGPLKKPEWESVMFTSPPKEQEIPLSPPPPKARAVEAPPPRAIIVE